MENKNSKKTMGIIITIIAIILLVGIGVLFTVAGKYQGAFPHNSYVNGVDVSNMSPAEAASYYNDQVEDLEFVFTNADNSQVAVLGSSFGYTEELSGTLDPLLDSQTLMTRVGSIFKKNNFTSAIAVGYDNKKLKDAAYGVTVQLNEASSPTKNACIEKKNGEFVIIGEDNGCELLPDLVYDKLFLSISSRKTDVDLTDPNLYRTPDITTDYLKNNVLSKLDKAKELSISYDFSYTTEQVPKDVIFNSVDLDTETLELVVDEDALIPYISTLSAKYDTLGKSRNFTTSNGADIIIGEGIYGWQLNVYKTAANLAEHIIALDEGVFEPVYTTKGYVRLEDNKDIDGTYIELDLTTQHMWYYRDGEVIVSTDVVTGLPGTPRETPTGLFSIWSKETKRYLTGEDYKLWVEYWLPINWTGVGIHDAPWQDGTFGGDRYLTHGSHGCVNTPYDKVSIIYDDVKENTPVIVYKS